MYEKILQKQQEQRGTTSNVSDRSLEDLAKSLIPVITTDDILTVVDLTPAIASFDGNINHYTSEVIKKAKEEADVKEKAKKAAELVAKKAEEKAKKDKKEGIVPKTDEPPEWAQTMMEQNKKFGEDLTALKNEKVTSKRSDRLNKILKELPEYLANPIKNSFKMASFENEGAFDTYLQSVEKDSEAFGQAAKKQGLNINTPTPFH